MMWSPGQRRPKWHESAGSLLLRECLWFLRKPRILSEFSALRQLGELSVLSELGILRKQEIMPNMNYVGQRFGRITLVAPVEGRPNYWKGRCDCGNVVERRLDNLKRPGLHSCPSCVHTPRKFLETRVAELECEVKALRAAMDRSVTGQESSPVSEAEDNRCLLPSTLASLVREVAEEVSETPDEPSERIKHYPIPEGRPYHDDFYYYDDPEGLELESVFTGEKSFLGFQDTIDDVRQEIRNYLCSVGVDTTVICSLWV